MLGRRPHWIVLFVLGCHAEVGTPTPPDAAHEPSAPAASTAPPSTPVAAETPVAAAPANPVTPASSSPEPDAPSPELVLSGTITSIEPFAAADRRHRWAVTLEVDEVLVGRFDHATFSFLVHSPSKSGLELGARREVRAVWVGEGYAVDELQWRAP